MKTELIKDLEKMLIIINNYMDKFAFNGINPDFLYKVRDEIKNTLKTLKGE